MASQDQVIVDEGIKSPGLAKYGMRVQANLNAAYPESPIYLEEITDENREEIYNNILNSNVCADYEPATGVGAVPGGTGLGVDNSIQTLQKVHFLLIEHQMSLVILRL